MADVRQPLTEEVLRETREDLIDRYTEQQKIGGVPVPSRRDAEGLIDPILHNVEVDHDRERDRDMVRPDPAPYTPKALQGGEWYGEPEHSPRVPEALPGEKVSLTSKEVGTVLLDKATGKVTPEGGKPLPVPPDLLARDAIGRVIKHCIHESWSDPEWSHKWIKLFWGNTGFSVAQRMEIAIQYCETWMRDHGDPRKGRERKIIVG